jgi:hypothetical protein
MISKAIRGAGFSGCISYVCEKAEAIRMTNISAKNWQNSAAEMRAVASTNRTSKPCYHHILSFPIDERLDDEIMFSAASKMLEKMGLEDHQCVHAIHRDREHWHVHSVVNQINFDGKARRLDNDFRARPYYARQIEAELGLQAYSRKEQSANHISVERLEQIKLVLQNARSQDDLKRNLCDIGIELNEKSSRSKSLNFRLIDSTTGATIPGSKIDAILSSPTALRKHFSQPLTTTESEVKSIWNTARNAAVERAAAASKTWDELRRNLQSQNLNFEIITRSNGAQGLVFIDKNGNRIAASKISGDLSFGKLEKHFHRPPPPPKPKSEWEKYSQARAEHFQRIGKSPEQIKAELENINKSKENLWKEYRYKTSLISQCFSPQYRGIMRKIERDNFEKSKLRLEKQAQHLRSQRFPTFDTWKSGAVRPTPKPKAPSILQKLKSFFFPIAEQSKQYHQKHTYSPTLIPRAVTEPQKLRPAASTITDTPINDVMALLNHPTVVRSANALQSFNPKRSNNYVQRNDGQR